MHLGRYRSCCYGKLGVCTLVKEKLANMSTLTLFFPPGATGNEIPQYFTPCFSSHEGKQTTTEWLRLVGTSAGHWSKPCLKQGHPEMGAQD